MGGESSEKAKAAGESEDERSAEDFVRDVIPALTVFASLIHAFASLGLTVFLYVFYKRQS